MAKSAIESLDNDALRAEIARREQRQSNLDNVVRQARHGARLTEARCAYIEGPDAANADCEAAETALAKVVATPDATLEELFAAYTAALRADGRRNAVAAATADQLEMLDKLPQNPLSGTYQSRQPRHPRRHKGQKFADFIDTVIDQRVIAEMVSARNEWQEKLTKITNAAEAEARAAAEQTDDGHIDVDVPASFIEQYETGVAQLSNTSAQQRFQVQRQLFVAECGGKIPQIL
jgi:hypothetical protein